jgi:YHS domain-containing protein
MIWNEALIILVVVWQLFGCHLRYDYISNQVVANRKIVMKMKKMIKISGLVLAVMVALIATFALYNGITPISWGLHRPVYTADGYALSGYDVVSYFQGVPKVGDSRYLVNYAGSTWIFSTAENRSLFAESPDRYMPKFGGYCAKAISTGFTAAGDPTVFYVREGKLFLFSSEEVRSEFLSDPDGFVASCESYWTD